jgi:hypothetical protein
LQGRNSHGLKSLIFQKARSALFLTETLLFGQLAWVATLKQVDVIDLPGPPGKRFDYLTIDYQHSYLLSAHLAAGSLYVIDLKANKLLKAIPDVPGRPTWRRCRIVSDAGDCAVLWMDRFVSVCGRVVRWRRTGVALRQST